MQAGGRIVVFFSKNPSKNPVANLSPVCRHCVARLATADEKKRQKSLCRQPVANLSPVCRQAGDRRVFWARKPNFRLFFVLAAHFSARPPLFGRISGATFWPVLPKIVPSLTKGAVWKTVP